MLSGYQYKRAITLDYTKFASDLTDFPLLVKLTDSNFDFSKILTSGGLDIRFTEDDEETLLKFEREFHGEVPGKTVTANGNAQIDTTIKKFGTGSGQFDGIGDYLSIPYSSDFDFGLGDFTVETWVYWNDTYLHDPDHEYHEYVGITGNLHPSSGWGIEVGIGLNPGKVVVTTYSGAVLVSNTNLPLQSWVHIAWTRNGDNTYLFQNGALVASASGKSATNFNSSGQSQVIGRSFTTGDFYHWLGFIDEFRISKGIARWTSAFTPASDEYATDSYTKLLLHCNGVDASTIFTDEASSNYGYYWVKVPSISSTVDTTIYMFYGKSGDSDGQDATNTWDSYHKAVYHLKETGNGSVGEFIDSKNGYNGQGGGGTASYVPTPADLIYKGQLFDGSNDYIQIADEANLELGASDFTISMKVKFTSTSGNQQFFWKGHTSGYYGSWFGRNSSNYFGFQDYNGGEVIAFYNTTWSPTPGVIYDIEMTRNGSSWNIYVDGVSMASTTSSATLTNHAAPLQIGGSTILGHWANGVIDEVRFSIGLDRGSFWRNARIASDKDEVNTIGTEEAVGESVSFDESIYVSEDWLIEVSAESAESYELITISESWDVDTNPKSETLDHTFSIAEVWSFGLIGDLITKINTKLYTKTQVIKKFMTDLRVSFFSQKIFNTELYLKAIQDKVYETDLRVRINPIDSLQIGTLDDFLVKLDGVTLTDVDYNTLLINLSLNTTPSKTTFILSRRHDDLDKKLDGSTSVITNQNKIEVFDGSRKLFTGYISEIEADSTRDVVNVTAEDIRRRLSQLSMELKYGGDWKIDSNHNGIPDEDESGVEEFNFPSYIYFSKNTYTALEEVFTSIGGLISGHDTLPFSGSFVPEYVKSYNDYVSLIDELIRQTANCNWYVDENERIRFQPIGLGTLKTLALSSLNSKRHPYDLFIHDVHLNKMPTEYAKSYLIKCGKDIRQRWQRRTFSGWMKSLPSFVKGLDESTCFDFQQWGNMGVKWYCGMNQIIYGYADEHGWVLKPTIVVQWADPHNDKYNNKNLPDLTVGSGSPQKTIFLESYGKKTVNEQWAEEIYMPTHNSDKAPWLVHRTDESYDRQPFLLDLANFQLSQNNKLMTSANVSMILDAYEYYNLSFKNLINLSNTIQANIYSNNNGFPLNISDIQINCAQRTVQLSLTNYGKSWYSKTTSYITNWRPSKQTYILPKQDVIQFSQGLGT